MLYHIYQLDKEWNLINNFTLTEYLLEHEIKILNKKFYVDEKISEEDVIKQIALASYIHRILSGYPIGGNTRIKCSLGRDIEKIKYDIRKNEKNLEYITIKTNKNDIDKFLIKNGKIIIDRCINIIEQLRNIDYFGLIRRAMNKKEICLGNIDGSNLRVFQEVEIGSIEQVEYNLIEEDIYNYLRKVRKKNKINLENTLDYFVQINNLNNDSKNYIKLLLNLPYDTLKYWKKYRKKGVMDEELLINIRKAFSVEVMEDV